MNFIKISFLFVCFALFISCDNEVELNADYEDTTVIFGLIDAGADTQFVRVTKTFLRDGVSALDLAKDPQNLYYDSLAVSLIDNSNGQRINLQELPRSKQAGLFSSQGNKVYYTITPLKVGNTYGLEVRQPDGKISSSSARTLNYVSLSKPSPNNNRQVSFVNNISQLLNYDFQFDLGRTIAKFEAKLHFVYRESINGSLVTKQVEMPIGSYSNSNLENLKDIEITFPAERFYKTVAEKVVPNSNRKVVRLDSCLIVEIFAADESFVFYQELNGPLDGISQVRPEYTNIVNGIGLFASRSTVRFWARLNDFSRTELKSGSFTGNHNFVDP